MPHLLTAGEPAALPFDGVRLDPAARVALALLGDRLRRGDRPQWVTRMMGGEHADVARLGRFLSPATVRSLVGAGLASIVGSYVSLAVTISDVAGVLTVIPKEGWGDEVVYLGEDSIHLVEAAFRLAPTGTRAADIGAGTGLLAAVLAARFPSVVGTEIAHSVAVAADLTLALNRLPSAHSATIIRADVARGLREDAFDLVVANTPWVPLASESMAPRELFAHGGEDGVELPGRFMKESAGLLRPGGLAVILALDVEIHATERPLREVCEDLRADGFLVEMLATPFNVDRPHLAEIMAARQPRLTGATHVAVIVARPAFDGDERGSLMVAVEGLRRDWDRRLGSVEGV